MSENAEPMGAWFWLQLQLFRARLLPRFMLLGVAGAACLPILGAGPQKSGGQAVAQAASLVSITLLILSAVLGAISFSGDSSSGALRAVMVRPLSRPGLVLGRALALLLLTLVLYVLGMLLAWWLAGSKLGFQDVRLEGYTIISKARLLHEARWLLVLPLPAILTAPLVALLVSTLLDDVALSVVVALAVVLGPALYNVLMERLPAWVFTEQALRPLDVLQQLSRGIETEVGSFHGKGAWGALVWPLWTSALALVGSMLALRFKDMKA